MSGFESERANRGSLDKLIHTIADRRGLDLSQYRRAYVERRVMARMRHLGFLTYRQYIERLDRDPGEYAKFLQTLTINVTDFFRDDQMWTALRRQVIPTIVAEKHKHHGRTIRAWSAGCATGEEVYSLAIALLEVLGEDAANFQFAIHGTDIDPDALAEAEAGFYSEDRLKHLPLTYRQRYFVPETVGGVSGHRVGPLVRRMVRFSRFSLFDKAPMRLVDIVLCRNVFIYFDRAQQGKVLAQFCGALSTGGFVVLGKSEKLSADAASLLETVDAKERIYRKPVRA